MIGGEEGLPKTQLEIRSLLKMLFYSEHQMNIGSKLKWQMNVCEAEQPFDCESD